MSNQGKTIFDDDESFVGWELGWSFWVIWVITNTVGWLFSSMVRQAILEASGSNMKQIIIGVGIGITMGFAQWFVLLTQSYKIDIWWALTSIVGWGIGWAVGWTVSWTFFSGLGFGLTFAVIGAVAGISVGLWQWLILRGRIYRAGWWIVANALGWSMGLALTFTLGRVYGWIVTGLVAGVITGWPLIWLLRHPIANDEVEHPNNV